ncbi:MAG TPA: hypothetical protein VNX15_00460 [Gemmatimonadales bacterium]|nr:hypothetical protein [Gemmatimonadales bacterium]
MRTLRALGVLGVLGAAGLPGQMPSIEGLPASVRAVGLGGAGAALVGDASVIFSNPAGLATVRHLAIEGSYAPITGGSALSLAAVALRVGRFDWGAGAQVLSTPGALAHDDAVVASSLVYRRGLLAFGVTGKYAHGPGTPAAGLWAGDAGVALPVFDLFALGVSVQNIGGDSAGVLPRRVRAGFTMNYVDPEGAYRLLTTLEAQWLSGVHAELVQGLEAGVVVGGIVLVGRVAYGTAALGSGVSKMSAGGGVELGRFHLDYAYRPLDRRGEAENRFGVRWTP